MSKTKVATCASHVATLFRDGPANAGPAASGTPWWRRSSTPGRTRRATIAGPHQPAPVPVRDSGRPIPAAAGQLGELARVLGGGIVPGSVVLIGGDPASARALCSCRHPRLAGEIGTVLYVSAEESAHQIKMRADRLGLAQSSLYVVSEVSLDRIIRPISEELAPGW